MPRSRPQSRRADKMGNGSPILRGLAWGGVLIGILLLAGTGLKGDAELEGEPTAEDALDEPLVAVRIEGNHTISNADIAKHIKTRPGRAALPKSIKEDVETLYRTRWFAVVTPALRQTDAGLELVFKVIEKPIVRSVTYQGIKPPNGVQKAGMRAGLVKDEIQKLEALTGLKKGSPYDIAGNKEAARRIEQMYHEKGYAFCTVELERGDKRDDREVVFRINKGPKVKVAGVDFIGNKSFSDQVLALHLRTKKQIAWLIGGKYDPATIPDDMQSLNDYYRGLGYFDMKIEHKLAFSKDKSRVRIQYLISEGLRYKIRNTFIEGNRIYSEDQLRQLMAVKEGESFNAKKLGKDVETVRDKYGELGRLFAKVDAVPRFLEEPGVLDLVYKIDEDKVIRVRDIRVHFEGDHPHSKVTLPRNISRIQPGDLADPKKMKATQRYLEGSGYFGDGQGGQGGVRMEISRVTDPWIKSADMEVARGQTAPDIDDPDAGVIQTQDTSIPPGDDTRFFQEPGVDPFLPGVRDPNGPNVFQPNPPDFIDIDTYLTEARTGRLMFGVGVNSNAGLIGNIVFSENNFDIFNPPTSLNDIWNGNAWRGAGQKFRIEAMPGTQVSRYLVDWQDPYFMDSDYNLGVSGFYYNRYFRDWTEQRIGGRLRLGRQLTQQWTAAVSLRLENVDIFNPAIPTPPLLAQSVGSNFLSTVQAQLIHDTRDAAILPGAGHYVAGVAEQAFAEYNYTHLDVEGRQYFTVYQRPDGGGRHTLMFRGELGWTGTDTPIYERFYAGGFQSFRGFQFRGVTPVDMGVQVGGRFLTLGTVEYMFPVMANEMVRVVTFSDFGTVEQNVTWDNFRVAVGAGLRLQVPMMGPVPIALDFAVPIVKQDFDRDQVFSFYIGANW